MGFTGRSPACLGCICHGSLWATQMEAQATGSGVWEIQAEIKARGTHAEVGTEA